MRGRWISMCESLREDIKEKLESGYYHCAKEFTLSVISGKYKVVILWHLGIEGPYRFNGLQKLFDGVSHKTLSNQLKELVEDGIISRKVYPEMPPKVEYSMTELGYSLLPIIEMMYEWGTNRIQQLQEEGILKTSFEEK